MKDDEKELIDTIKTKLLALRVDTLDKQVEKVNEKIDKLIDKIDCHQNKLSILFNEHNSNKERIKYIIYPLLIALIINIPVIIKIWLKG